MNSMIIQSGELNGSQESLGSHMNSVLPAVIRILLQPKIRTVLRNPAGRILFLRVP